MHQRCSEISGIREQLTERQHKLPKDETTMTITGASAERCCNASVWISSVVTKNELVAGRNYFQRA